MIKPLSTIIWPSNFVETAVDPFPIYTNFISGKDFSEKRGKKKPFPHSPNVLSSFLSMGPLLHGLLLACLPGPPVARSHRDLLPSLPKLIVAFMDRPHQRRHLFLRPRTRTGLELMPVKLTAGGGAVGELGGDFYPAESLGTLAKKKSVILRSPDVAAAGAVVLGRWL